MKEKRIHRAVSADGTEIAGRVEGQGPALVLIHAPVHDSDMAWEALLPFLADRFTCYLPNLRGRGLSGDHPDPSPSRSQFQEDINAFIDSIGEPVFLMGWSDSCSLAFGAAAHSDAVAAVVAYEPSVWTLMPEDDLARFGTVIEQHREATAEGRLMDATHNFHHFVCTDEELAALDADYLDRQASLFPLLMQELQQEGSYKKTEPTDPEVLAQIDAPVLVLLGQKTRLDTWFTDSAQHVVQHVANAHIRELPDLGHFAPLVAPEPVASETIEFFERHAAAGSPPAAGRQPALEESSFPPSNVEPDARPEQEALRADRAAQRIEGALGPAARVHRAVSPDGTELAGQVYGQGPPLVLVHAGLGNGTLDWAFALPYLRERFTCYCMSTRGRGLSADNPDQSLKRGVEDVVAFVESIGESVALAGPSGGTMFVLGAAAQSTSIAAAAACDPLAFEMLDEQDGVRLHDAVERMAGLAAEGRFIKAGRDWMTEWANRKEMDALSEVGYFEASATYVPLLLQALQEDEDSDGYSPTDPAVLTQISAPVLILQGSQAETTWPWFKESVRHVAEHVPDATVREIPGAGHMGAWVKPKPYAEEMIRFFTVVNGPV
jgi:pimeloyl-ACP methyl ester carboxylesterase